MERSLSPCWSSPLLVAICVLEMKDSQVCVCVGGAPWGGASLGGGVASWGGASLGGGVASWGGASLGRGRK